MNENVVLEQTPAESPQQLPANNEETNSVENVCSVMEQVENAVREIKILNENATERDDEHGDSKAGEVNTVPLVDAENEIQEDEKCMDIDENIVPKDGNDDEESITNTTNVTEPSKAINDENTESHNFEKLCYDWTAAKQICLSSKEFKPTENCENFTKGCYWSPDGTCILVPCEDYKIRIFELPRELYSGNLPEGFHVPSLESALRVKEGGTVYDTCWFPYMSSWDPSTCCFLSTSQGSPVHLWDAFTGQLRATYRAYNQVDEVEAAISVQFTDSGGQVWSGFKNALRLFDTNRPGRQTKTIYLKKDFPNVMGLVSCIRENPGMPGLIAFGTYSKCIGLYKDGPLCSFQTGNGVTQVEFSPCGTKLYSAVRRGSEFLCWDLRNPGTVLYSLQNRQSDTNQRIQFSLSYNGEEIVSGGTDGAVRVWQVLGDLQADEDINPIYKIKISKDCVNGVSLHKNLPILAVSTGRRICEEEENRSRDNSLSYYWLSGR